MVNIVEENPLATFQQESSKFLDRSAYIDSELTSRIDKCIIRPSHWDWILVFLFSVCSNFFLRGVLTLYLRRKRSRYWSWSRLFGKSVLIIISNKKERIKVYGVENMFSRTIFAVAILSVVSAAFAKWTPYTRAECAYCTKDRQCSTKKCWNYKCVFDNKESMEKCFKKECEKCEKDRDCSTDKCWNYKCVNDTMESKNKCFTPECESCEANGECATGYCYRKKCVFFTKGGIAKCYPPTKEECEECSIHYDCKTGYCKWGKCVRKSFVNSRHCFLRDECAACKRSKQCKSGKCWNYFCTDGSDESIARCTTVTPSPSASASPSTVYKGDCEPCSSSHECASYKCSNGLCGGANKVQYCPKDECSACTKDRQCKTGKCWDYICTDGSYESLVRCGYKEECETCDESDKCATQKCWNYKCVFDTDDKRDRCFS